MKQHIKVHIFIVIIAIIFALLGGAGLSRSAAYAAAASSPVLSDLQKDVSFNAASYPEVAGDYSLKLIQLAESTDNELLLYVYQPSGQKKGLRASSINIAPAPNNVEGLKFSNYKLTYLNSAGVFYKYRVDGFEISDNAERYYNISNIYRNYDLSLDGETGLNSNTEKANPVGQLWTAKTTGESIVYRMEASETIEILNPVSGYIRYFNGFKLYHDSCDAHFVAFDTDKKIDKLYEADVYFHAVEKAESLAYGITYNTIINKDWSEVKPVKGTEKASNPADGLFAKSYEWERIQTAQEFIKEDLKDDVKAEVEKCQYVLRFLETPFIEIGDYKTKQQTYTSLDNVTILRLKFKTDGKVYNLGAVMNKITELDKPANNNQFEVDFDNKKLPTWLIVTILVVALIVLTALCAIFKPVWRAVKALLKLLWLIVSAPFRLIAFIIRKCKGEQGTTGTGNNGD